MGGCSFSRTWTRINNAVAFTEGMDQFKLYTDGCNTLSAIFNQDDFLSPTGTCQDLSVGLAGAVNLNEFIAFPGAGDTFNILMQIFVTLGRLSGSCLDGTCNGHSTEFNIPVTACDVSPLIGDRDFTKTCTTAGCTLTIEGHVIFA